MPKPMIRIHNTETNEVIDREMTVVEFKQYEIDQQRNAQREIEAQAKENQKQEIFNRLGLTADEVKLLFG